MGIPRTDNPKVIAHIEAQHYDQKRRMYGCGCILAKDETIMLCQWHDGYDEGLAAAAEQETPMTLDNAEIEIENLRRWKAEATEVLSAWLEIAEVVEAFRPPRLGSSHSDNVVALVREAIAAAEQETP